MPIILFLITVLSRLPFTSRYLYHMDSGHFALALEKYDVALGQPHPPGYFLYVMLGRLVNLFVNDANSSLILVSILFSGLTVSTMYYLGRDIFSERIGILAAILTIASPNFWFHGEVALSYSADAFFSALVGLLCWRAYQGKTGYVWISALALGIAGGFRQNTGIFLLPLWLFSARHEKLRSIAVGASVFCMVGFAWFIPMVAMSGGLESYMGAFRELWTFNTGHNSVFEKGMRHLIINMEVLYIFFFYNLGVLLPVMLLAFYGLARKQELSLLKGRTTLFTVCWMAPALLFYLLVFISGNPGYVLILLPPLIITASASISYLGSCLPSLDKKWLRRSIAATLLAINAAVFLGTALPVTRNEIADHDADMRKILENLRAFHAEKTLLLIGADSSYSYRHLMIYLPEFTVYQADVRTGPMGAHRQLFGGVNGKSIATDILHVPDDILYFAAVIPRGPMFPREIPSGLTVAWVTPDISIISGPIGKALDLYPELKPYLTQNKPVEDKRIHNARACARTAA